MAEINTANVVNVGIGRSLLNFNKSVPMAGYSVAGSCSEGIYNDLTATCFNIDNKFFLVTVDLMGLSCLLVQTIVEYCNNKGYVHIRRDNLVINAIHNHTAMGGFFDSDFYNAYASNKSGFIKQVFDFLVENIANAIIESCKQNNIKICKKISYSHGKLDGIQINRSFKKEPYNDVDIISFVTRDDNNNEIYFGHLVYISVHPTMMGMECKLLSSDFFGIARDAIEVKNNVQIGFINVALGDQAPFLKIFNKNTTKDLTSSNEDINIDTFDSDSGYECGKEACEYVGTHLAHQILSTINSNSYNLDMNDIGIKTKYCDIHSAKFIDTNGNEISTESDPRVGFSALIGSEEAQVPIAKTLGFRELNGEHLYRWEHVLDKKPEITNLLLYPFLQTPCWFLRKIISVGQYYVTGYDISNIPHNFNIYNYWFGSFKVYTSPFELTSGAVEEIVPHLNNNNTNNKVILTSITDTYLSYLCNANDYDLQSYEGASTLYGRNSCQYLLNCYLNMDSNDENIKVTKGDKTTYNKNKPYEGDHLVKQLIYKH